MQWCWWLVVGWLLLVQLSTRPIKSAPKAVFVLVDYKAVYSCLHTSAFSLLYFLFFAHTHTLILVQIVLVYIYILVTWELLGFPACVGMEPVQHNQSFYWQFTHPVACKRIWNHIQLTFRSYIQSLPQAHTIISLHMNSETVGIYMDWTFYHTLLLQHL